VTVLSEGATNLLAFLDSIHHTSACEFCAAASLGVDRYDVLNAIRELILNGRILCRHRECSVCFQRRLTATIRTPRPAT